MDGGQKSRYYAAILSGKNDRGLWSLSTVELFVSSFLTSPGSDFIFIPRMRKALKRISLPACLGDVVSSQKCFVVLKLHGSRLLCHSKWQHSIQIPSTFRFTFGHVMYCIRSIPSLGGTSLVSPLKSTRGTSPSTACPSPLPAAK